MGLLVALVIVISLFWLYRRNKAKKRALEDKVEAVESLLESSRQEVADLLSEDERASEQLRKILSDDQRASEQLRKMISEELELFKKVTAIRATETEKSKHTVRKTIEKLAKEIFESTMNWDSIYTRIEQFYPNAGTELNKRMPDLSEKEKQLCYLMKVKFRGTEIAFILGYEYDSLFTLKNRLHKKYHFKSAQDFDAFIENL